MAENLVPALSPKLGHGHREPRVVHEAWSLRDRLAEDDLANDGAELVHGGVNEDHAAYGDAQHAEGMRERIERVVEDGIALEAVPRARTDKLRAVVRAIYTVDCKNELRSMSTWFEQSWDWATHLIHTTSPAVERPTAATVLLKKNLSDCSQKIDKYDL